jgi:hypothetical protein
MCDEVLNPWWLKYVIALLKASGADDANEEE